MKRVLLLALGLALVARAAGAQEFIRYHPPQILYNGSGFATPGVLLLPDGTAAAPSLSWVSETNLGIYRTTNAIRFTVGGAMQFSVQAGNIGPGNDGLSNFGGASARWGNVYVAKSTQGAASKSLTDAAAATAFVTIAVPTNSQIGGELIWTATSSAAAVRFVANGSIRFWGTDQGGTPVCGINKIGTDGEGHSSGANTLVCTWTNVVATTNCALSVTCTNDTAGTDPVTINGRLDMPTTATATFN